MKLVLEGKLALGRRDGILIINKEEDPIDLDEAIIRSRFFGFENVRVTIESADEINKEVEGDGH